MDHRVFEPRPNGNDARRRQVLGMALVVLAACALWLYSLRTTGVSSPAPTFVPVQKVQTTIKPDPSNMSTQGKH